MIFLITLLLALLFNLYVTIFGKQDIQKLKNKISFGTYLKEINKALDEMMGDTGATILKSLLIGFLILMALFNLLFLAECIIAIILGAYLAKKAYQVSFVNNWLNKLATYINRLRN